MILYRNPSLDIIMQTYLDDDFNILVILSSEDCLQVNIVKLCIKLDQQYCLWSSVSQGVLDTATQTQFFLAS